MTRQDCEGLDLQLTAYQDGELDQVAVAAIEEHLKSCPGCAARIERERRMKALLERHLTPITAPVGLRDRVQAAVRQREAAPARRPPIAWSWVAVAAALVLAVFGGREWGRSSAPAGAVSPAEQLVTAHIRSLQLDHLTDVPSSEHHTVRPWFDGKLDFAPPVPVLDSAGFALVGGRLDYLLDRPLAAIVYRRRQHLINLFLWPDSRPPTPAASESARGYNLVHGVAGAFSYWAVSDLNAAELADFAGRIRRELEGSAR